MKSIKHVFDKIVDFDNLYTAYLNARRDKRYRTEILKFSAHLEDNLIAIQNRLMNEDFVPGPYREFYIYEPKKRLIMAQPFEDRVIQWAFYQVLNPVFVKGYITDSYACIPGRGQIAAVKRLQSWLKALPEDDEKKLYVLKLDVSKYFYRASHSVIIQEFNRRVSDKRVQEWLRQQIQNPHVNFGLPPGKSPGEVPKSQRIPGRGMPVGALVSQMLANLNMNPLDQYCKRYLKMKHYIRYNDDIIILHYEKLQLHAWKDIIEHYMNERLQLQLNDKTCIRPATLGIDFCGYKIWRDHIKLRKSTALRMKRRLKGIQKDFAEGRITLDRANQTVHSYQGIMKHCDSYRLRRAIFGEYSEDGGMTYEGWFKLQRDSEKIEALKKKNQNMEDGRG